MQTFWPKFARNVCLRVYFHRQFDKPDKGIFDPKRKSGANHQKAGRLMHPACVLVDVNVLGEQEVVRGEVSHVNATQGDRVVVIVDHRVVADLLHVATAAIVQVVEAGELGCFGEIDLVDTCLGSRVMVSASGPWVSSNTKVSE